MKDERLMIRITRFEKMQLKQEAERRGMTPSELVKQVHKINYTFYQTQSLAG